MDDGGDVAGDEGVDAVRASAADDDGDCFGGCHDEWRSLKRSEVGNDSSIRGQGCKDIKVSYQIGNITINEPNNIKSGR